MSSARWFCFTSLEMNDTKEVVKYGKIYGGDSQTTVGISVCKETNAASLSDFILYLGG